MGHIIWDPLITIIDFYTARTNISCLMSRWQCFRLLRNSEVNNSLNLEYKEMWSVSAYFKEFSKVGNIIRDLNFLVQ